MVVCPECINNGSWKQNFRESGHKCGVCGPNRTITFSQRDYYKTSTDDRIYSPDPLGSFVDWILFDLNNNFDTVAFSHFGGRFDMLFVFKELYNRGFNPDMIRRGGINFYKIKKKFSKYRK